MYRVLLSPWVDAQRSEGRSRGTDEPMSAFGGKHCPDTAECPLLTQSGRRRLKIAAPQLDPCPYFTSPKSLL
jgi:hypothetical protein